MQKKWIFPATVLIMSVAIIILTVNIFTQSFTVNKREQLNYVALGDSITYGYQLKDTAKNFPTLLSENLNAELTNYAVVGSTSEQLLQSLENGEYDLSDADLITLGIGSNDLLQPFHQIVEKYLETEVDGNDDLVGNLITKYSDRPLQAIGKITQIKEEIEQTTIFDDAVQKYCTEIFPEIISEIRRQNDKAKIIVLNLYNPYFGIDVMGLFNLGEFSEKYICKMNEVLLSTTDFETVNVYNVFQCRGMTNVYVSYDDFDNICVDPHPTEQGHMVIYSIINQSLENAEFNKNY